MSVHACNAREILRAQRNGNDKIYIARLLQQNGGIFKIPIVLLVSICEPEDELKPKQIRLPFSEKFPSKLLRHVSHPTKTIAVTGINLATDVDHPYHKYKVCITCYRFSAYCHCSLSRQAPWRKVKFVVSAEKLASALFAEA